MFYKILTNKRKIMTLFYAYIVIFIVFSFIILTDLTLPANVQRYFNNPEYTKYIFYNFFKNQFFLIIALLMGGFFLSTKIEKIFTNYYVQWLIIAVVTLMNVLTLFIGESENGAVRWLDLKIVKLQPSEFTKIAVIFLAIRFIIWYKKRKKNRDKYGYVIQAVFLFNLLCIILGKAVTNTVLVYALFTLVLIFTDVYDFKIIKQFLIRDVAILIAMSLVIYLKPEKFHYFVVRIQNLFLPHSQLPIQIIRAHRSYILGGFFGNGFSGSIMKYLYLFSNNTDYVLASIGETLGFLGVIIVLGLLISFSIFLMYIAVNSSKIAYKAISYGYAFIVLNQTVLHTFVTVTSLSTGVQLPFFSAGKIQVLF